METKGTKRRWLIYSFLSFLFINMSLFGYTQNIIHGNIKDKNGEPLVGVNVILKGTLKGTVSDINGEFSIQVEPSRILIFSYIGYVSQEINIKGNEFLSVILQETSADLDEVVVVGYGIQKKSDLTGAVSHINSEEISSLAVGNAVQALQGRASGVYVTQNTGAPGGDVSVKIRGVSSINNNEPLYVIDGFPTNSGLQGINPSDIESVDILKDASATAIYGTRASNGIVIVTTKKGTQGKAKVSLESYYGFQEFTKKPKMLNQVQFAEIYNESLYNLANTTNNTYIPYYFYDPQNDGKYLADEDLPLDQWLAGDSTYYKWVDEVIQTAPIQNYNLSIQGGSDKSTYMVSMGYFDQTGVIIGSHYNRYNFRVNTNNKITNWLRFGNNLSIVNSKQKSVIEEGPGRTILGRAMRMNPSLSPYRPDGTFSCSNDNPGSTRNPLRDVLQDKDEMNKFGLQGTFFVEADLTSHLKYRLNLGGAFNEGFHSLFYPAYGKPGDKWSNEDADAARAMSRNMNLLAEHTLSYINSFGKNSFTLLLGYTAQEDKTEYFSVEVEGFSHPALEQISSGQVIKTADGGIQEWSLLSQFGRLNYNYDEKYYVTATLRRDGSSRFGEDRQFGYFPSFAVKWKLLKESFFQNIDFLNDLSLRAGYGETGNQEIGNYERYPLLTPVSYVSGNTLLQNAGLASNDLYNEALQWETAKMTNIGIDVMMFSNQLQFNAEYYRRGSEKMLLPKPLPLTSGIPNIPNQNIGEIKNEGVEFNLEFNKKWNEFSFSTGINASYNRNEVVDFGGALPLYGGSLSDVGLGFATISKEGIPAGSFYGYVAEGIFQNEADVKVAPFQNKLTSPGDVRFRDLNGDGKIDDKDRTVIGNPWPAWTFGWNLSGAYKGWSLNLFFQGVQGNDILYVDRIFLEGMTSPANQLLSVMDRWTSDNPSETMPRVIASDPNGNNRISTRFVEDGSYIRLKNIVLSYDFPKSLLDKFKMEYIQIYLASTNAFTLTNFSGVDPEIGQSSTTAAGIARGQYPATRNTTFGIKVTF